MTQFCVNLTSGPGLRYFFAAILDFRNRKILFTIGVQSCETYQHAKFCQNRSIGCEDIKIFRFCKMAASAKFHQNRLLLCGDIAILRIFKMVAARILSFGNHEILLAIVVERV